VTERALGSRALPSDSMTESEDHRLLLLGAVVDTFASIELRAQLLLSGFVLDELIGEVMAADLPFSTLTPKLMVLATLPGLGQAGVDLREWTTKAVAVSERRNGVIHALWWAHDPQREHSGSRIKLSARGRATDVEGVIRVIPQTVEDLEELVAEMNRIALAGGDLTMSLRNTGTWAGPTIRRD
jgi:hypothetical protein